MHPADQPLVPRALRLPAGVVALLAAAVVAVLGYRYAGDEEAGRVAAAWSGRSTRCRARDVGSPGS